MNDTLYIIVPYFNFFNWSLFKKNLDFFFFKNKFTSNSKVILSEGYINYPLQDYSKIVYKHFKFELKNMFWAKENLINLAINRLPKDWQYAVWIDRDIIFESDLWIQESIEKLKNADVIQTWNKLYYLNKDNQILHKNHPNLSIFYTKSSPEFFNKKGHSGMGWGINKNFYNKIGKILDWQIVGGGDVTFAFCCGMQDKEKLKMLPSVQTEGMRNEIFKYSQQFKDVKYDYVNASIYHYIHGTHDNRQYKSRWDILHNNNFDPSKDIIYNNEGIIGFTECWNMKSKKEIESFFLRRKEDDIDTPNIFI